MKINFNNLVQILIISSLLLIFSPLFIVVSFLIFLIDKPPVFFRQDRLGLERKKFSILKFKTMKNQEVTILGKWLRANGIDELPQLINILRGEMKIVGPRPLTEEDVIRLGWQTSSYDLRWQVKPGITGLAQLSKICDQNLSWQYDQQYVQEKSWFLDFKILLLSFLMMLFGKNFIKKYL